MEQSLTNLTKYNNKYNLSIIILSGARKTTLNAKYMFEFALCILFTEKIKIHTCVHF